MLYFYPTAGHPDGVQDLPWFIKISDLIFPWTGHPGGTQGMPWYSQDGDRIRTEYGNPEWLTPGHEYFHVRDQLCYPSGSHPAFPCDDDWYRIVNPLSLLHA